MRANRFFVSVIAVILLTTVSIGVTTISALTSTTPLAAKDNETTVNVRASDAKHVIFRDDDIAPWSSVNTLKAVNQVHTSKKVPVTLAIIPHPDPSQSGNELLADQSMLNYLKSLTSNSLFELAQHGYNHKTGGVGVASVNAGTSAGGAYYPRAVVGAGEPSVYWRPTGEQVVVSAVGASEFAGRPYGDQYTVIKQGWDDINQALGVTPTTFVPPWNLGDANTLTAVRAVGHTLYSTGQGDLSGVSVPAGMTVQPVTFQIPWQANADWNTAVPGLISQTDSALDSAPAGADIVILYHFWSFEKSDGSVDSAKISWLQQYIDHLKSRGDVVFTTLGNEQALPSSAQTKVTLTASSSAPVTGQSVTFTCKLSKKGTWGWTTLTSQPIQIWHTYNGVRYDDATVTTGTNGQSTLTTNWATSGERLYYATFAGDSSYQQSLSVPITINVETKPLAPTNVSLTASATNPDVGQPVTFIATLKNGTKPISSEPVTIYHYYNGVRYNDFTDANTNASGQIAATVSFGSAGQRTYYATFSGDSSYAESTSSVLNINVETKPLAPTNVSLTASTSTPAVGQSVTFNATLKNGTTPLSAKPVTIYHYSNGVRYNDVTNQNTDAGGQVTATATFGYAGQRTYYATFGGDSSYGASTSSALTVTVQ
jgi:Uncharacterized protein conserved in bacteria (DUF2334)/Bacterial Ig-like domain (group 3)